MSQLYQKMKVIALRGIVVFPGTKVSFEIGREKSVKALMSAIDDNDKQMFLVSQKSAVTEDPEFEELAKTGVIVNIEQVMREHDRPFIRISAEGTARGIIAKEYRDETSFLMADVISLDEKEAVHGMIEVRAMKEILKQLYDAFAEATGDCSKEEIISVFDCDELERLTFLIASSALDDYRERQEILDESDVMLRSDKLCRLIARQTDVEKIKAEIDQRVKDSLDKAQREYYLREEMKIISEELGEGSECESEELRQKVQTSCMTESAKQKLLKECDKLSKMQFMSPEATVVRTYIEEVLSLPWGKYTEDCGNTVKAREILDKNHYGLDTVKDRFIEMLCANKLGASPSSQVICLIGPPGTGKTSVSMAAAKAMGRSFARISLGGICDEAEIRGHRKTYIGSMPGRIINALKQTGSSNAFILLDEIDKLSRDYKGDPASALLEVLDGEQNNAFTDHYIEVPFDLSKVIFVTTANDASTVPAPLYDRMEIIEVDSYTFEEKVKIARKHLVKKQLKSYGILPSQLKITKSAIEEIIERYTRESGVRALEKHIATICRKAAVELIDGAECVTVNKKDVEKYLKKPRFTEKVERKNRVGAVNGLAWTASGGEVLTVEAAVMQGSGKTELTGNLGDVMKESAKIAVSLARRLYSDYGIDGDFYKNSDIHIHFPMGAVPKDGPSAGITVTTALVSALSGRAVRGDIAMTGEISLSGEVMPIGGLKEKSMAAYKNKIGRIIIPRDNVPDLCEISGEVKSKVEFIPVDNISQVLREALI